MDGPDPFWGLAHGICDAARGGDRSVNLSAPSEAVGQREKKAEEGDSGRSDGEDGDDVAGSGKAAGAGGGGGDGAEDGREGDEGKVGGIAVAKPTGERSWSGVHGMLLRGSLGWGKQRDSGGIVERRQGRRQWRLGHCGAIQWERGAGYCGG